MNTIYLIALCLAVGFGGGYSLSDQLNKAELQEKENALTAIDTKAKADMDLAKAELLAKDAAALLLKQHIENAGAQNANIISDYAQRVRVYTNSHRDCKAASAASAVPDESMRSDGVSEDQSIQNRCLELTPEALRIADVAEAGVAFALAKCGIK